MHAKTLINCPLELKIAFLAVLALAVGACAPKAEPVAEPEPVMEEVMEPAEPEPMMAKDDIYVVAAGDSLWAIAGSPSIYNDPFRWPLLYGRNKDIEDADLIFPNQEISVPRDLTNADIGKAIEHARNRGAWSIGEVEQSDLDYRSMAMMAN